MTQDRALRRSEVFAALVAGFAIGIVLIGLWLMGPQQPDANPIAASDSVAESEERIEATTDTVAADAARPGPGMIGRIDSRIAGRLAADPVRTAPLQGALRIRARDVRWLEPGGRQWASAPALSASLDANAFRGGDVIVRNAVLERANILLTQTADDVPWNYERVFEEILGGGSGGGGPATRFEIHGLRVVSTRVDVRLPDRRMIFQDLNATASRVRLAGPGLDDPDLRIAQLTTTLVMPAEDGDTRLAISGADADLRIIDAGVAFDVARATIDAGQIADLLARDDVRYLAEMMNYPGVIYGDEGVLDKLEMYGAKVLDGHAPSVTGKPLQAYVAAGISSDHECTTVEEAAEKLRLGLTIFIREGTTTRNWSTILKLHAIAGDRS